MPKPSKSSPWLPAKYQIADVAAIQALRGGTATAEQQARALEYIVVTVCRLGDMSFRPGFDGARETAFAEGKRSIGRWVALYCMWFTPRREFRALLLGRATAKQQKRALKILINWACGTGKLSFRRDDRRACFREGQRFVGNQITKLSQLPLSKLREEARSRP